MYKIYVFVFLIVIHPIFICAIDQYLPDRLHDQSSLDSVLVPSSPSRLFPTTGPKSGATVVTIWGGGFSSSKAPSCRFTAASLQVDTTLFSEIGRGVAQTVPGTLLNAATMVCRTPTFKTGACGATDPCTIKVTVSNDGESFTDWQDALPFTWDGRPIGGTFTYERGSNTTGPLAGATLITLRQTPAVGSALLQPSDNLRCGFMDSSVMVSSQATWIRNLATGESIVECLTPTDVTTAGPKNLLVRHDPSATWFDTGLSFAFDGSMPTISSLTTRQYSTALPARGPLIGRTVVTVSGSSFLPSENSFCLFSVSDVMRDCNGDDSNCDTVNGWKCDYFLTLSRYRCYQKTKARFISSTEYRCPTPVHRLLLTPTIPSVKAKGPFVPSLNVLARNPVHVQVQLSVADTTPDTFVLSKYSDLSENRIFTYTDIYVSPSGSDDSGDGTADSPLETIDMAVHMALLNSCDRPVGSDQECHGFEGLNADRIVLLPGVYRGMDNVGISSRGKTISIVSAFSVDHAQDEIPSADLDVVVDCGESEQKFILDSNPTDSLGKSAVALRGITLFRCVDGDDQRN